MKTYTALTIGPIYKTISRMKKVREIWGASYIFSKFMRLIIKELLGSIDKSDFLVPYIDDELVNNKEKYKGIGFFHDRLIFQTPADQNGLEILNSAIEKALNIISADIKNDLKTPVSQEDIVDFLKAYLLYYSIEIKLQEDENPILKISPYLDTLELRERIPPVESLQTPNYLIAYLLKHGKTLRYDADHIKKKKGGCVAYSFPSIPQITIDDILKKHPDLEKKIIDIFQEECQEKIPEDQLLTKIEKILKEKNDSLNLKPYHKYIAIVQADGDNMGKEIELAFEKDRTKGLGKFSENLIKFAKKASEDIVKYGGHPIYIGGDDLLFFAPVFTELEKDKQEVTIFDLIDTLDSSFKNAFSDALANPSLSFGLSITYYKYPMAEALENAYTLLTYKAKKIGKEKDAIAVELIRHSGQSFAFSLSKKQKSYTLFKNLLKNNLTEGEESVKIPHALQHKLAILEQTVDTLLQSGDNLDNFFENFFNEEIHKEKFDRGLQDVQKLLFELYHEMTPQQKELCDLQKNDYHIKTPAVYMLFSLLSTIKLLRGDA